MLVDLLSVQLFQKMFSSHSLFRYKKKIVVQRLVRDLSSTVNIKRYPVCILGGGPVGLLLSTQLSRYGVKHCVIERRVTPTKHPQAHFMNARTMEILQGHLPNAFKSVLHEMPSSENWR